MCNLCDALWSQDPGWCGACSPGPSPLLPTDPVPVIWTLPTPRHTSLWSCSFYICRVPVIFWWYPATACLVQDWVQAGARFDWYLKSMHLSSHLHLVIHEKQWKRYENIKDFNVELIPGNVMRMRAFYDFQEVCGWKYTTQPCNIGSTSSSSTVLDYTTIVLLTIWKSNRTDKVITFYHQQRHQHNWSTLQTFPQNKTPPIHSNHTFRNQSKLLTRCFNS